MKGKMKKLICISQKEACAEDFFVRTEKILKQNVFAFILREKSLSAGEYEELALKLLPVAKKYPSPFFLNGHYELACGLGLGIQLSFQVYQELRESPVPVGISVHSAEEAEHIVRHPKGISVSHILAGHVFPTDCKKGLAPRGLEFLSSVCKAVDKKIPVFGLGGVSPDNMPALYGTGAYGGAIMSSCMKSPDIEELFKKFAAV